MSIQKHSVTARANEANEKCKYLNCAERKKCVRFIHSSDSGWLKNRRYLAWIKSQTDLLTFKLSLRCFAWLCLCANVASDYYRTNGCFTPSLQRLCVSIANVGYEFVRARAFLCACHNLLKHWTAHHGRRQVLCIYVFVFTATKVGMASRRRQKRQCLPT